jgi:hypothetical protein
MRKLLFAVALAAGLVPSLPATAAGPCHTSCKELAKSCKHECKAAHGLLSAERYQCNSRCRSREHECFASC